jgi:hypothetical protein
MDNKKASRKLINKLAYMKKTNKEEYIKYKNKINDDKMTKLLNDTHNINNNIVKINDTNDDNDIEPETVEPYTELDETTSYYMKKYKLPLKKDNNTIKLLLNKLVDDNEYLSVLEILIKNKEVYTHDKYINNIKMLLIDNYNVLYNEIINY